jgi:hypothetical protein
MRLIIQQDPDTVASWVATYIKKRILAFAPTPERPFVLGEDLARGARESVTVDWGERRAQSELGGPRKGGAERGRIAEDPRRYAVRRVSARRCLGVGLPLHWSFGAGAGCWIRRATRARF